MITLASAIGVLKTATKQLPALRYAWGVIGLSATAAIAIKLNGDGKAAVIAGALAFIGFVLMMIISTVSKSASWIQLPAKVLTWSITFFFIVFLLFTILAYAESWPCNWVEVLEIKSASCRHETRGHGELADGQLPSLKSPVRKLRLDLQEDKKSSADLNRVIEILRAEYGNAKTGVLGFEFLNLANRSAKDDLIVIFFIENESGSDRYISVFAAKEQNYDLVFSESTSNGYPDVFLVNEGEDTYLVMASYEGSRGFMTASVYRRLSAGNFKKLTENFVNDYNKSIEMLDDGLYLFSAKERLRMVFKGDAVSRKRETITPSDLGSATHELVYLKKKLFTMGS